MFESFINGMIFMLTILLSVGLCISEIINPKNKERTGFLIFNGFMLGVTFIGTIWILIHIAHNPQLMYK